jgi:hypothetical protein
MPRKLLSTALVVASLTGLPVLTAAQPFDFDVQHIELVPGTQAVATPQCSGGVVYDDGSFNVGYSIGNGDPNDATMVMDLDLPGGTTALDQVCVCLTRNTGGTASMSYQIVVYNDNGPGGAPGTLLGTVNATASSIPVFPNAQFYSVNLSGSGITLPDTSVYVGMRWPGGANFLCGDTNPPSIPRPVYGSGNSGASWSSMSTLFPINPPRTLGIRADPHTSTPSLCTPNSTTLCLNGGRFKVQATFQTPGSTPGTAQVVKLTDETGYLWFFSPSNVEVVVKVLNACGLNNRYWVFAGGLTNVRVVMTVTDTETGAVKTYTNPQSTPYQPLQDTAAFATCP